MWIQQVSSGLLPLPSIHLKSLLCSNGAENTVLMAKNKKNAAVPQECWERMSQMGVCATQNGLFECHILLRQ